jgi:hypothetical protein
LSRERDVFVETRGRRAAFARAGTPAGVWNMCPEALFSRLESVDNHHMAPMQASDANEFEFFGVKLKVKNPHLAALLNSDVHEDVQVIGRRAREALRTDEESDAEREVAVRMLDADDSVTIRLDEADEV